MCPEAMKAEALYKLKMKLYSVRDRPCTRVNIP